MSEIKNELIRGVDEGADSIQTNTMPQNASFRPHPDVVAQRLDQALAHSYDDR